MLKPISRRLFMMGSMAALGASACEPPPVESPRVPTPPTAPVPARHVIIIGAGITGLAAALDLVSRGFETTILEASKRPGGRIHTLRSCFPEGLYVEAGATHVVPDPHLIKLIQDLGVQLTPRLPRPKNLSNVFLRGDQRLVIPPGGAPPEEHALTEEEKALEEPFGRITKYFSMLQGIDPTQPLPAEFMQYDALSAAEYLQKQGASQGYIDSMRDSLAPDRSTEKLSALALMRELANFMREVKLTGPGGRIAGGSDRLPSAMAERLGSRVIYNASVKRIEQTPERVRVRFIRNNELNTLEAERVISTLPSTVLRDIEAEPGFSEGKQRALRELAMASVTRIWVATKERYWLARGEAGRVETDSALGQVRDETENQEGKSAIVGMYVLGDESRKLSSMSVNERLQTGLSHISRAHPGLEAYAGAQLEKCWDNDPLTKGAYASFGPGQLKDLLPALMKPEGRVHFAGDQTSHRPGFMHGALSSARRVVKEVAGG